MRFKNILKKNLKIAPQKYLNTNLNQFWTRK